MSTDRVNQTVLEIEAEARLAMDKWKEFDKVNTTNDFIGYTIAYLGRAVVGARRNADIDTREMLVKAGGLIVSTIENLEK
jgi:hypothetical protein